MDDDAVADTLLKLKGYEIRVHYKEKFTRLPWHGETKYLVDKVWEVK